MDFLHINIEGTADIGCGKNSPLLETGNDS